MDASSIAWLLFAGCILFIGVPILVRWVSGMNGQAGQSGGQNLG